MGNGGGDHFAVDWRAVGIGLFLATHLGTAIWYGGRISKEVEFIRTDIAMMRTAVQDLAKEVRENSLELARRKARLENLERQHNGRQPRE